MSRRKQHKMSATFGADAWAWRRIDRSLAIIQAAVANWLTAIADTLPHLIKTCEAKYTYGTTGRCPTCLSNGMFWED